MGSCTGRGIWAGRGSDCGGGCFCGSGVNLGPYFGVKVKGSSWNYIGADGEG